APMPCGEMVGRLQAEMEDLVRVINDQHRYIQGLHHSQAQKLPQIPQTHLQTGDQYKDCAEIFKDGNSVSGLYMIRPDRSPSSFMVFCDMSDGGGWTVFQRRKDGTESFDRFATNCHGMLSQSSSTDHVLGDSTPAGAENIFGISVCSGNSHIETSLGGMMFNMLFTFVSQNIS
ncbi:unnamed protein product, partial [Coregonus sp. 'balchen']